jgi:cytochrome-b5 reductase
VHRQIIGCLLLDAGAGWTGGAGFVTADMIKEHLPPPGPDTIVLRCGPLPMNKAMEAHLDALGYEKDAQFLF